MSESQRVLAFGAHPDDIEFMMAGTMLRLQEAGCELHYWNVANGSCGSSTTNEADTIRIRTEESRNAAAFINATFHLPLVNDLEVYYEDSLIRKVCAVIREINPSIVLLLAPFDYMEDHMNSVRIGVTATFCKGMQNFTTIPPTAPVDKEVAVYHALPYGLKDPLCRPVEPDFYVDITPFIETKRKMLNCHQSQKLWLDHSQGLDNYLNTLQSMSEEVGKKSGAFQYAEGWRRRLHLGFGGEGFDPIAMLLKDCTAQAG